jgi:hypothetical protein
MRPRTGSPGPGGIALLGLAAAIGVILAIHGWSARHTSAALGSVGNGPAAATARPSPAHATPSAAAAAEGGSAPAPAATPGPLLSSQSYAQYAYQVWPGTLGAAARAAEIGLAITAHRQGNGLEVSAGVIGQPASAPQFYPAGARVYVIEASPGDDSGTSDYNLGDDGLVVTDAQGRIVQ